jgi:hypothetical protein
MPALQMQRDPTAADRALAGYRGKDEVGYGMLRAEARGRGIAEVVLAPHTNTIWFLAGDASGAIFSLSEDRRIRVTSQNTSTMLATDLLATGIHAHAATRGLLAYGRTPSGIAVLDLKTRDITPIEAGTVIEMDITPDGSRLAALDSRGKLTVWALSPERVAEKLVAEKLPLTSQPARRAASSCPTPLPEQSSWHPRSCARCPSERSWMSRSRSSGTPSCR